MKSLTRTELINALIERYEYKSYLEIGVCFPSHNFDHIAIDNKVGVDPNPMEFRSNIQVKTSDEYFKENTDKFDIIFIDGLHQEHQVTVDIINALTYLNKGGTIVTHDNLPGHEIQMSETQVPGAWFGTGWKSVAKLRMSIESLSISVVDVACGMAIIRPGKQKLFTKEIGELNFKTYIENRVELLNVIDFRDFIKKEGLNLDPKAYLQWDGSPYLKTEV